MTTPNDLSEKALAVFAFAIYHQLESGDVIAAREGAGHRADPDAIAELKAREMADVIDDKVTPGGVGQSVAGQTARTLVSLSSDTTVARQALRSC